MTEIRQISRYHRVGQGLFYSASFYNVTKKKQREVRYIIDCGSSNGNKVLKQEIDDYIQTYIDKECLDFLIISHLHADHVSGLSRLLSKLEEKKVTIKNLFLPYLDKATRVFLYLLWKGKIEKGYEWILEFILEPVEFLKQYNIVENIIFIHGTEDKDEERVPEDNGSFLGDDDDIKFQAVAVTKPDETELIDKSSKNVIHVFNCKLNLFSLIEFDFWFKSCSQPALDDFKDTLRGLKLEEALKKVTKSSALYKAYEKLQKDFNDTSLCVSITNNSKFGLKVTGFLMSQNYLANLRAIKTSNLEEFSTMKSFDENAIINGQFLGTSLPINHYYRERWRIPYRVNMFEKFGYLFTGDINLAPNKDGTESDTFRSFINHYNLKRVNVAILLVPHHGSQNNWDRRILEYFLNPFSIISSGKASHYRHPDFSVVNDINPTGWSWVNDESSFNHGYTLTLR
ncbi:MBL fold metallo-hydrolase [Peribacillus frigoritolerans]|uniref:MBL fold metallo-hydrolase n=1 Tax=Peribacillus frigoritolerans TaxID=450367 RepID=UPI002E1AF9D7|nr:MBL fold metallo-hydrolase [Peribacillus frigoritolerans]